VGMEVLNIAATALPMVAREVTDSEPLPATDAALELEYEKARQDLNALAIEETSDAGLTALCAIAGFVGGLYMPGPGGGA